MILELTRYIIMEEKNVYKQSSSPVKEAELLWLRYYNSVLLEKGLISEELYKQIERKIIARSASSNRKKNG